MKLLFFIFLLLLRKQKKTYKNNGYNACICNFKDVSHYLYALALKYVIIDSLNYFIIFLLILIYLKRLTLLYYIEN